LVWKSIARTGGTNPPQLVAEATEWQAVTENGVANVVNIVGAGAGPLRFAPGTPTNTVVRHIMAVVQCPSNLRGRSTLFCGEELFRTAGRPWNNPEHNEKARMDTGRFCGVSWRIDGVADAPLVAGKTHLVEVEFSREVTLHTLGVGSDTGREEWLRAWGGSFFELVGFSETPSSDAQAAVVHYLNLKWRLGLKTGPVSTDAIQSARALGAHLGPYFGTLLIVR